MQLYISYMLSSRLRNVNTGFTLNNCLFESIELTKNADPYKQKYSSYGIGLNSRSEFSCTDGNMEKNIIILGADMSSSVHTDSKNRDEAPTETLDYTTLKSRT